MIKILFVDDDAIARQSIETRIPWKNFGWDLCYTAKDGVDALDYMKNNRPDIVLSDIKMPIMNGIQMAVIAKDYYPDIKFIFLSGYKDFEYAKQALKLNAIDYLTKPISAENLISVIQKAETLVKKDLKINRVLREGYPTIQRHYISKLMYNNFLGADDATFKAFDINLEHGLGITGFVELKFHEETDITMLLGNVQEACLQLCERYPGSFFLAMDTAQIFMIYTDNDTSSEPLFHQKLVQLEQAIASSLPSFPKGTLVFQYGTIFNNLNQLYLSYQAAQKEKTSQVVSLLFEVKHYIETHYQEFSLTLLQIANHFNINHCYLTSLYKEKFGINLYDYLIQVRMEKAACLLQTTSLKSYEIAEKVGYSNSQYFSISFKKFYKCTVTEYKSSYYH